MTTPWTILTTLGAPWAHLAVVPGVIFDVYPSQTVRCSPHTCVRILRGSRCQTKDRLLQEWAAALQFPAYFGHNWDAFDECITDLWWLPPQSYLFIITSSEWLLCQEALQLPIFFKILHGAADSWARWRPTEIANPRITPFHVIFQCEPDTGPTTRQRLLQATEHLETVWGMDFIPPDEPLDRGR